VYHHAHVEIFDPCSAHLVNEQGYSQLEVTRNQLTAPAGGSSAALILTFFDFTNHLPQWVSILAASESFGAFKKCWPGLPRLQLNPNP
jgi:hypothetical protein